METNLDLRGQLLSVEKEIKQLIGKEPMRFYLRYIDEDTILKLEELADERCSILNQMFKASPQEVKRFEEINTLLYELTQKTYKRTPRLYRSLLKDKKDPSFDDDYNIEGILRYVYNDEESVLQLEDDEYYASDFNYMLEFLTYLIDKSRNIPKAIENTSILYNPEHTPNITDEELDCVDSLNDGQTWAEGHLQIPEFKTICICYAVHDICLHKPYSIPDLLRMNDFWIEVQLTCQHIINQSGKRFQKWGINMISNRS